MKITFLLIVIAVSQIVAAAQMFGGDAEIAVVYSHNNQFYLKTVPYDNESPSLRGRTSVYEKGNQKPLYVFERGFDQLDDNSNNLVLSNDGQTIFYAINWGANEKSAGLKSVTVYRKGEITKSFTAAEITGCNEKVERCSLVYSNYEQVVDRAKSKWGSANYKKAFKSGVDEKERFLSDFAIFSFDDTVYLTDSKKNTHQFDLKTGARLSSDAFDVVFELIKSKGRFTKIALQSFGAPTLLSFPKLKNNADTYQSLAAYLGMKSADGMSDKDEQFKIYSFKINCLVAKNGSLEIEDIESDDELPKNKIIEFFKTNRFDARSVPAEAGKWHFRDKYFYFRNKNDQTARAEKKQQEIADREESEKRRTAETIEGIYIPKNLGECFLELDKLLKEVDKKEMLALGKRGDMISYHMGLGTWMRNNWGLWGGSRLQQYFKSKGVGHSDEMSSIVLYNYYDWLKGNKNVGKDWEENAKTGK